MSPLPAGKAGRLERPLWFLLLLCLIGVSSIVDRQVISVLVDPIRQDLGIGDLQIGLVQGVGFGLFYALMAFPLGALADQHDRRLLIAACLTLWSIATILGGLATSFTLFLISRALVGVGEAGLLPAAFSLIADKFEADRLGRAMGVFLSSLALSTGLSFLAGGALATWLASSALPEMFDLGPWRLTMILVAVPGPILALLLYATTAEPARRRPPERRTFAFRQSWEEITGSRAFLLIAFIGSAATMINQYAVLSWFPTYLIRWHGFSVGDVALYFAPIAMAAGTAGAMLGGLASDRLYRRRGARAPLIILLCATAGALILALAPIAGSPFRSLLLFGIGYGCFSMTTPMAPMLIQLVVPQAVRARVSALWLTTVQLSGLSLGPIAVPLLAGLFWPGRDDHVGFGLALVSGGCLAIAVLAFAIALRRGRDAIDDRHRVALLSQADG